MLREIFVPATYKNPANLEEVSGHEPVFAKDENGKLVAMAVLEDKGWIFRCGGDTGLTGYDKSLKKLIKHTVKCGYTCFISEDKDE